MHDDSVVVQSMTVLVTHCWMVLHVEMSVVISETTYIL